MTLITSLVVLICARVFLAWSADGNLSNFEGINEVKLTMSWVQYLRDQQVKDADGNLLASKYLVDENGVAFSGKLTDKGEGGDHDKLMENFLTIQELVGCGPKYQLVNASRLRLDLVENPDGSYAKVWSGYAKDMFLAIRAKQIGDQTEAKDFLEQFRRHVFKPWLDVINARYNCILRADRQDAIHLAVLRAHRDSFAVVRERMFEKLIGFWPEVEQYLPKELEWNQVHGRIHLDHIKHEFEALAKYRDLRKSVLNQLKPSERQLIIEVLPLAMNEGFHETHYSAYEIEMRTVYLCQDGDRREIDQKYLVKLENEDRIQDEHGRELNANKQAPELRRFLWRLIHKAVERICLHVIKSINPRKMRPIDHRDLHRIYQILLNLKEAVLQRANALNGMIDEEVDQDFLTNFYAHRNSLNNIFDQLRAELPSEKVEIYENLMRRLNLVLKRDVGKNVNRFQLKVDRESLKTNAKRAFLSALDRLHGISLGLASASETLGEVFEKVVDCYENDCSGERFRKAFNELKSPMLQYSKFLASHLENNLDSVNSNDGRSEGDNQSHLRPEIVLAKYKQFSPIVARESAEGIRVETEQPVQWDMIQRELKNLTIKLDKTIRKVVEDLDDFRTNAVAHAIKTNDERSSNLIRDVFKLAREVFDQVDERETFNLVSNDELELQLKRVQRAIKQRNHSIISDPHASVTRTNKSPMTL